MGSASIGVLRLARAWVAVALMLGLAGVGHSLGGGSLTAPAVLVLAVLLAPVALAVTGVRWTVGRAVGGLGAGQVLVHVLLSWMAPATHGYAASAHLSHGAGLVDHLTVAAGAGSPAETHAWGLSAAMVWAHVLATVATALLVGFAEEALWAVLARLLPRASRPARLPADPALPVARGALGRLHGIPVGAVAGRGPPAARGFSPA